MSSGNLVEQLDAAIANFFSSWNIGTTIISAVLVIVLLWPILTGKDPDIHPFLLARQAQASPVRQPKESPVYRSNDIPYGYPLRRGLGVKDPGAPKWNAGRDGDLRDVWRQAVRGPVDDNNNTIGKRGKILTILGRQVIEQDLDEVTLSINAIGTFINERGGKVAAVSLSNSVELLAAIFASAFYDFKPVLIPYGIAPHQRNNALHTSAADTLIAEAGSIDLNTVLKSTPSIKHVIWVAKEGSKHLDWNEVPQGMEGKVDVSTWHELVDSRKANVTKEVPPLEKDSCRGSVATFWLNKADEYVAVEYTPQNLVAAIGGLLASLGRNNKIDHTDVFLTTTPLSESYSLCWTLAALYSSATVALNSVAGDTVDITLSVPSVQPTIIVTSSGSITTHADAIVGASSGLATKLTNYFAKSSLESGVLPRNKSSVPSLAHVRILLVSQRDHDTQHKLSSRLLFALRLAMGTRIAYALTTRTVAGAVSQTNLLDYRNKGSAVNVGAPLSCVEVLLTGEDDMVGTTKPKGMMIVRGPAVVGMMNGTGVVAQMDVDHTIDLI